MNECPKSYITTDSRQLVQIVLRSNSAHDASGAAMYGADLSKWPARMIDAVVVVRQEENRESNARTEAEMKGIQNG